MSLVRPITRHDIKGPAISAGIRDDYRTRIIASLAKQWHAACSSAIAP